jgi:hypothetical protein
MKFDINVNQRAIIEHGLDLDLVDGAILDYCLTFARSGSCQTRIFEDELYYWFEHKNICDQLPILKMKPDSAYRRMKGLCDKKFLKAYKNNKQVNGSWYALGLQTDLLPTIGRKSDGAPEPTDENPMVPTQTIGFSSEPSEQNPMGIGNPSDGPSEQNPMYKYIRELEYNNNSNTLKGASAEKIDLVEAEKKEEPPEVPAAPPQPAAPVRGDPFFLKRDAEQLNVPFSLWWDAYGAASAEATCRTLWIDLTDEERTKALQHTPLYIKATPKRWRKSPINYLELKFFNEEIINRHENDPESESRTPELSPQREIIRTEYRAQKFKRSSAT